MKLRTTLLPFLLLVLGGCDSRRGMQVRTYELHRLELDAAETLLTPYISEGGYLTGKNRLLTGREKPAQLDSIARILQRYDGAPQTVMLHFQVIEAGDFAGADSSIARVAAPLRELFRYRGYRLVGELTVRAMEGARFSEERQGLRVLGQLREATLTGADPRVTLDVTVESGQTSVTT